MSAGPPDHKDLLPVLTEPRPPFKPLAPGLRWIIRLTRALLLVSACFLMAAAQRRFDAAADVSEITLDDAQRLFPSAVRFGPHAASRHGRSVVNASGETLGLVLETSPQTDHLIGYSGPSNLLIGLDPDGDVIAVRLLWSRDTPEHVEQVRSQQSFWDQFPSWNPTLGERPDIEAVSGSTLTSLAMAESIEARLAGGSTSLRFPLPLSMPEVQSVFPGVDSLDGEATGWTTVLDSAGDVLGYVLRTSPFAENVRGYSGPTEALVAIDKSRRNVIAVRMRSSYDTPEYVDRVRGDEGFLQSLAGRSIDDWTKLDFAANGIEGVSGATQTSFGLAEGIRRRLQDEAAASAGSQTPLGWRLRDLGLIAVILGGLIVTLVPGFGERRIRTLWQIVLVAVFGLWLGDMLSISLVAGWSRHGMAWSTAPGLVALAAVALVVPWTTRRQVYCHALCPHGAVQEWLGRARQLHVRLPRRLNRFLGLLPGGLLITGFALALTRPAFNLSQLEPFDAWVLGPAAVASFVLAITGLVASVFVPQAYCRFGCPTGALLKLVRSHGQADRLRPHDVVAAGAVCAAALWLYWPENARGDHQPELSLGPSILTGQAFGTTWTIKVGDPLATTAVLQDEVAVELERIEARLSHWRPNSETSQFNASQTMLEIECSKELASLAKQAQELSEITNGAFDITVGPLVDAWGYGPSGPKSLPPTDARINTLLQSTGWNKLEIDDSVPSLRKRDPALQIDLGSLLQGYAVDRVHDLLRRGGLKEFLIEIGGELRASGSWQVALDPAAGQWTVPLPLLTNQALSTSGIYRRGPGGEVQHIISPITGRPVETRWKAVAVIAATCREADAWDTALLVAERSGEIATTRDLTIQMLPKDGGPASLRGSWYSKPAPR